MLRQPQLEVACRFAKRDCDHGRELFQPKYQRVNRSHGTKILRCFPHCCPTHIPRSYCGSSLELEVTVLSGHVDPHQISVYARFRAQDDESPIRIGEAVLSSSISKALQSQNATKAPWIDAREQSDRRAHKNAIFEINPSQRWYYPWQSGKNSRKRATPHVLEAFVFVSSPRDFTLRCVAKTTSTGFTLVSFRRVSEEESGRPLATKATGIPRSPSSTASYESTREVSAKKTYPEPPQLISRPLTVFRESDPFSESLATLFAVSQEYPIRNASVFLPGWCSNTEGDSPTTGHLPSEFVSRPENIAVYLVHWLLFDQETQDTWKNFSRHGAAVLLDSGTLKAHYQQWKRWLEHHIDNWLSSQGLSPIDRIAAAAFPLLQGCSHLAGTHPYGWNSFVALCREKFTRVSFAPSPLAAKDFAHWTCPLRRVSGASLLENYVVDPNRSPLDALPVSVLFGFWQQLSSIWIHLETNTTPKQLVIASSRHGAGVHERPVTTLLLDNRFRWFNALPHGESTIDGLFGDYIATERRGGTIEVSLFTWASNEPRRWRWSFARSSLDRDSMEVHLLVQFGLPFQHEDEYRSSSACESLELKLSRVKTWRDEYQVCFPFSRVDLTTQEHATSYRQSSSQP